MTWAFFAFLLIAVNAVTAQDCPQDDPELVPWNPGFDELNDVTIDGQKFLLNGSATVRRLHITNGGKLVIEDTGSAILFRAKFILVTYNGEFHIGGENCRYNSPLTISLFGLSTDFESSPGFGRKFIGVAPSGTLEIHGPEKISWTVLAETLQAGSEDPIITTEGLISSSGWGPGDRIVIASTDFSMYQAEEFDIIDCPACNQNQFRVSGSVNFTHMGEVVNGIPMRAEVGLLTRSIKIRGEMQPNCYADNSCEFFDYDTFGGQTQFLMGFKAVHIQGVELYHMGQQVLGSYPIHFHRNNDVDEIGGYANPAYVRQLSVHNSFSRCVTVHATDGLTVEDVVGYRSLGHCFFLEDGSEQRNTFNHNLGLVTEPGTLLPSDRNSAVCQAKLGAVYPGYTPNPDIECRGVSTFWIAHPNNNFVNNSAAGSEEVGFFFVFHREPTGPSEGLLDEFHSERSPMGVFSDNVAHSNFQTGLLLDRGVKIDAANQQDQREFLALSDHARYMPHQNQNLSMPRMPAILQGMTIYKNNHQGAFVRGGDVYIHNSRFADNGQSVVMASEQTLPHDPGSHQEVSGCLFVGESDNRGNPGGGNRYWGQGADGQDRSMPQPANVPFHGVVFYDGPILIKNNTFNQYVPISGVRRVSALGFQPNNPGQSSPANRIEQLVFDANTLPVTFGTAAEGWNADGDKTQIFFDSDVLSPMTYFIRRDVDVLKTASCVDNLQYRAMSCAGPYAQLYIQTNPIDPTTLILTRNDLANRQLDFSGVPSANQYQPVVLVGYNYSVNWNNVAPGNITLSTPNLNRGGHIGIRLCYPANTTFQVSYDVWRQLANQTHSQRSLVAGASVGDVDNDVSGMTYFWDSARGFLHLRLYRRFDNDPYDYCTVEGCERVHIRALMTDPDPRFCT